MFPSSVEKILEKYFIKPAKAYGCFVSNEQKQSHARFVHMHFLPKHALFALNTSTRSRKVSQITDNPKVCGQYWHQDDRMQCIFYGHARMADSTEEELQQKMWLSMREETRLPYLLEEKNIPLRSKELPDIDYSTRSKDHGVILIEPNAFDIYHVGKDFRMGDRRIFTKEGNTWKEQRVSILHSGKETC